MKNISILDCTLRDGGYVNNWEFGCDTINSIVINLQKANIDIIELGFLKGHDNSYDNTMFSSMVEANSHISEVGKSEYALMIDMGAPVSREVVSNYVENRINIIRLIFKKDKIEDAYEYAEFLIKEGYDVYIQPVGIDQYTDDELLELIKSFNELEMSAFYIVDSFGVLSSKDFIRIMYMVDNNLKKNVKLGYHSHNNMQQAFSNSQIFAEAYIDREIIIDCSIYGMGRGAGNLNEELFATYLNDYHDKNYYIEPLLDVIDKFLLRIFDNSFWGYSLPLYLSAKNHCHPNYALYFSKKFTLSEKSMNEIFRMMSYEEKINYSEQLANNLYKKYMDVKYDDEIEITTLKNILKDKEILIIAPGKSIVKEHAKITKVIEEISPFVITVNFNTNSIKSDAVFCSNERRISELSEVKFGVATSNIRNISDQYLKVNYSDICGQDSDFNDNSTILLLRLLIKVGIKKVYIAGVDGYSSHNTNYAMLDIGDIIKPYDVMQKNDMINRGFKSITGFIDYEFITEPIYWK